MESGNSIFVPASGLPRWMGGGSTLLNGLVNYWNLDEVSGSRADSVGGVTLTDNNAVGSAAGKNGNCATFVGASSKSLSVASYSVGAGDFTLALWFNQTSQSSQNVLMSAITTWATALQFSLYTLATSKVRLMRGNDAGSYVFADTPQTTSFGTWYHVVAEYNSSTKVVRIWLNNQTPGTSGVMSGNPYTTSTAMAIGTRTGTAGEWFTGSIDEVAVWNRLLTSDERLELYNSGTGKFYPFA